MTNERRTGSEVCQASDPDGPYLPGQGSTIGVLPLPPLSTPEIAKPPNDVCRWSWLWPWVWDTTVGSYFCPNSIMSCAISSIMRCREYFAIKSGLGLTCNAKRLKLANAAS